MIRTDVVRLTTLQATAYRQKLTSGGAGIVILRSDCSQPGIASISKTSGKAIPSANTPKDQYPAEAFTEAIELTNGLPYKKRKAPSAAVIPAEETEAPEIKDYEVVVDSAEYQKIVDNYTDKKGRLSYPLINRDMIRFAHSSSVARSMVEKKASVDEICLYVVGSKFRGITGNRKLSDEQVLKMVDLLEQENPHIFEDPQKTFADLYMKSGMYITEIVTRLYRSKRMNALYPDNAERLNHIFARQVYGCAPTEIIYRICLRYILGFSDEINIEKNNIRLCNTLEYAKNGTMDAQMRKLFDL